MVTVSAGINGVPAVASLSPSRTGAGTGAFGMTVNGSELRARIRGALERHVATDHLCQQHATARDDAGERRRGNRHGAGDGFSPAPGGGKSAALPFSIAPPPALTVSATTAAPGTTVTVTLTNGLGGLYDWLAFAATTAPNTSYLTFVYIGGSTTTRTWTVTMPATPGPYKFRLLLNNGYTRAATSPTVTVIQP